MRHSFGNWSDDSVISHQRSPARHSRPTVRAAVSKSRVWLIAGCWLLTVGLLGCESLERKFARKPKGPPPRPNPIVNFEDYTRTMTPLDRYRKHYLMFDYWNGDLMDALQVSSPNPKRYQRASSESISELHTMQSLVKEDLAGRFTPILEERAKIDRQLQSVSFSPAQANVVWHTVEAQSRQIHREFFWRSVEDQLKPQDTVAAPSLAHKAGDAAAH